MVLGPINRTVSRCLRIHGPWIHPSHHGLIRSTTRDDGLTKTKKKTKKSIKDKIKKNKNGKNVYEKLFIHKRNYKKYRKQIKILNTNKNF